VDLLSPTRTSTSSVDTNTPTQVSCSTSTATQPPTPSLAQVSGSQVAEAPPTQEVVEPSRSMDSVVVLGTPEQLSVLLQPVSRSMTTTPNANRFLLGKNFGVFHRGATKLSKRIVMEIFSFFFFRFEKKKDGLRWMVSTGKVWMLDVLG